MKKFLFYLLLISFASCDLDLPENAANESSNAVPMSELNAPEGFNFGTTKTLKLKVSAVDAEGRVMKYVPFQVVLEEGGDPITLQAATTGEQGAAELLLNVPNSAQEIFVQTPFLGLPAEKSVSISGTNEAEIVLGDENKAEFNTNEEGEFFKDNGRHNPLPSEGAISERGSKEFTYMGSYNSTGKPNYLMPKNDQVSYDLLKIINASLPEGYPVPVAHPEYLDNDLVSNIILVEDAEVWVTFVHEGAGYTNALGYYYYDTDKAPTTIDEISKMHVIFPNVSYNGSGGSLVTGNKVYLGSFTKGTTIAWFLVPEGWNSSKKKVDWKENIKFSDKHLNTFTSAAYRQHVALLYDQSLQKLILGMEDLDRPSGDNDFNDAVFYVNVTPFTAVKTTALAPTDNTDDDDGDGVSNSVDVEPKNPAIAFHAYTPAQGTFGTLAFEDLFPNQGDYDMNDLVVDYNFKEYLNAKNEIVKMDVSLKLRAAGGVQHNGFGFEMGVSPDLVASVTGAKLTGNAVKIAANGTEHEQAKAVILAFDDALALLGGGTLINTEKNKSAISEVPINLEVVFKAPVERAILGAAPFNPFMFVNGLRGKEVHLPDYTPTSLANAAFFGSGDDISNPQSGKYYKAKGNLPFAINIPVSFAYPMERAPINQGHLKFTDWAKSGGSLYSDWYKNLNGYRLDSKIF
jgi:LruC domain-containing protein